MRGLGWDLDSAYSSNRGELLPLGSFGHTGWTGTSLWIDPATKTWIVILTNRVHPDGKGNATAYLSYRKSNPVLQARRDFSRCTLATDAHGVVSCSGSSTTRALK